MRAIIIVNGRPRAGKDTTIAYLREILKANGVVTDAFSSIDPIRDWLTNAGFDVSAKTEADRALLSEVGDAVEKHSSYRSRTCLLKALAFFERAHDRPAAMFLHVREPLLINRIRSGAEFFPGFRITVTTVLVKSNRADHITSNAADRGVETMAYDHSILNYGSLADLRNACEHLCWQAGLIEHKSLLPST